MGDMSVTVVVVNFNTVGVLEKSLGNLEKGVQVVVVDNASTDGSAEMVRQKFPEAEVVALKKNVGLAAGNNVGLRKARGRYVLFMGSDAFPQRGVIAGLAGYLDKHPKVGMAVGRVVLRNGQLDRDTHRGLPTPGVALAHFLRLDRAWPKSRLFGRYWLGFEDLDKPHEIELCTSHFMFARKAMFDQIGEWDERFFVYGEDVDVCWRAKKAGWKVMCLPQFKIVHYKGMSVGIRPETGDITPATRETKKRMLGETTVAMEIFYKKHFGNNWGAIAAIKLLGIIRKIWRNLTFR